MQAVISEKPIQSLKPEAKPYKVRNPRPTAGSACSPRTRIVPVLVAADGP